MTQKQQEYVQKWEEVMTSLSLPEKLREANLVKKVGVPILRLIIFYLIVPLLKTGSLPKTCQMTNLCYSAVCRRKLATELHRFTQKNTNSFLFTWLFLFASFLATASVSFSVLVCG